jgi:hypothetical protein
MATLRTGKNTDQMSLKLCVFSTRYATDRNVTFFFVEVNCWSMLMMWIYWEKNTETLIDATKEVDLEVNAEKIKYMLLYRH